MLSLLRVGANFSFQNRVCNAVGIGAGFFCNRFMHGSVFAPPKTKWLLCSQAPFAGCLNNLTYVSEAWTGIETASLSNLGKVPELQLLACIVISFCSTFIVRNCATGQKAEMEQTKQALLFCASSLQGVAICEMPNYPCCLSYLTYDFIFSRYSAAKAWRGRYQPMQPHRSIMHTTKLLKWLLCYTDAAFFSHISASWVSIFAVWSGN